MAGQPWKAARDPLFRDDVAAGVQLPDPTADAAIVRHILDLDGPGGPTPYLSTTEHRPTAERFAGRAGRVYQTKVARWRTPGIGHLARRELLLLLRGHGKGAAAWPDAFQVMKARSYVEEHHEHLADFGALVGQTPQQLRQVVDAVFAAD